MRSSESLDGELSQRVPFIDRGFCESRYQCSRCGGQRQRQFAVKAAVVQHSDIDAIPTPALFFLKRCGV